MSKFAFIVGHFKCGTTWIINMLSLHPEIIGLAETNLFKYVFDKSPNEVTEILFTKTAWSEGGIKRFPHYIAGSLFNPVRKYWKPVVGLKEEDRPLTRFSLNLLEQIKLKKALLGINDPKEYSRYFFHYFVSKFPNKYIIEKSADHVRAIPHIKRVFPSSKLIAIFRDGRDFVISHRYYSKNMGLMWNFEESVKLWKDMIQLQLKYEQEYGLWSCSYESFLKDTRMMVQKILDFLELKYTDQIIENMVYKSSFEFITGRKRGQTDEKSFYRKGVSGDWKNYFSTLEKEKFKEIAGDLLIKLGYEKDYNW